MTPVSESTVELEDIRKQASLFGKSGKDLTKYLEQMNAIADDLCFSNPALLRNR